MQAISPSFSFSPNTPMNQLKTPILFLIFNRPEQTKRVFEAIRATRPKQLFVAADGPRLHKPQEADLCRETRAIATMVDWPCEIKTLFRDSNLGCGAAVSEGITWFFKQVEEGIILEDDCLPHQDFFPFCETLLARYRHETAIGTIAGTHFLPPELPHSHSHYVSKYFQMWGWASWRRVWEKYDYNLSGLSEDEWWQLLKERHPLPVEAGYWREILKTLRADGIDTWDFQMSFSCWRISANHVMPGRNLISNLGYGTDATHTNFSSPMANLPIHQLTVSATEKVPIAPNPVLDNIIFYLRFLDSMTNTWWLEQILAPDQKLSDARIELARRDRLLNKMKSESHIQRRQLQAATTALTKADHILHSRRALIRKLLIA
jgi:hypothetical protein